LRLSGSFIVQLIVAPFVAAVLAFQIVVVRPRLSLAKMLRDFTKARAAGDAEGTLRAAKGARRHLPKDARLRLFCAHSLFASGDFDGAAAVYEEITGGASSKVKAAALTGRAATLLAKRPAPADEDIKEALDLLKRARTIAPDLPDVVAVAAIARIWAGDEAGAREAITDLERLKEDGKRLGVDAAAGWYCARGFVSVGSGDIDAATSEVRRAASIIPARETGLGEYIGASMDFLALEAAARPGASQKERDDMAARLGAEGPAGLSNPRTYPLFVRAAGAMSLVSSKTRTVGLGLLEQAIDGHKEDPVPVMYRIAALASDHTDSWKRAAESKRAGDGSANVVSAYDVLPETGLRRQGPSAAVNRGLIEIEKGEPPLLKAVEAAAERAAALEDERGPELVLSLARFLFTWKMRQSELSANVRARRRREREALSAVALVERLLGDRVPRGAVAAALFRDAGAILADRSDTEAALAAFRKSLAMDPGQEDLVKLLAPEAGSLKLVATYPDDSLLHSVPPLVGVEFRLPVGVAAINECTWQATLGPALEALGPARPVEPRATRTGLWYLPEATELAASDMEARFVVTDPIGRTVEATVTFRVDVGPPVIVESFPTAGATIGEKRPVFRIRWKDLAGVNPKSVVVRLDPVTAAFPPQSLVEGGEQKTSRFMEPKWRRGDPAVTGARETAGEIFTSAMSELPTGSYRLTLDMEDNFRRSKKHVLEFEVR
jgi:tetratricopeptide (TPR) repeat protein